MAFICDAMLDAFLDYLDNADKLHLCSAEPTTYAEAASTYSKGNVAISSANWTTANGDSNGRKATLAAMALTPSATATVTHWAIVKSGTSELIATGALAAQLGLTSGVAITTQALVVAAPDAVALS